MNFYVNEEIIQGKIYDCNLEVKTVKNEKSTNYGKNFISGTVDIAVDDKALNVIQVHYTYEPETTAKGKPNTKYSALKRILDEEKTWLKVGPEAADLVKVTPAIALNEYYDRDNKLVSLLRNEGGFITSIKKVEESTKNKFKVSMVITGLVPVEKDNEEPYMRVKGYIFDFRKAVLPVEFIMRSPEGMAYLENQDISGKNPYYVDLWGKINFENKVIVEHTESAFGEDMVTSKERKSREWVITGMSPASHGFGDEDNITEDELKGGLQDREVMLAELRKRKEEYQANSAAATVKYAPAGAIKKSDFSF